MALTLSSFLETFCTRNIEGHCMQRLLPLLLTVSHFGPIVRNQQVGIPLLIRLATQEACYRHVEPKR
jgi:hypothetical protein